MGVKGDGIGKGNEVEVGGVPSAPPLDLPLSWNWKSGKIRKCGEEGAGHAEGEKRGFGK